MRESRSNESLIVAILKEGEAGIPIAEVIRKHGISRQTYFGWRRKYVRASVSDLKRLRELEAENAKLRADGRGPGAGECRHQGRTPPKAVRPSAKRQIAEVVVRDHHLPVQRACRVVTLTRTGYYVPPLPASRRDAAVIAVLW